jgi:hypothetical protein
MQLEVTCILISATLSHVTDENKRHISFSRQASHWAWDLN